MNQFFKVLKRDIFLKLVLNKGEKISKTKFDLYQIYVEPLGSNSFTMIWSAVDIQGQDKSDNPQIEFYQDRLCIPSSLFIMILTTCFVIFCFKKFPVKWMMISFLRTQIIVSFYLSLLLRYYLANSWDSTKMCLVTINIEYIN